MLSFCVLSSGSRANCTYVASRTTRVLVDCGLSLREVTKRLFSCGVTPNRIDAIVISHEHSDHVAGIPMFVRKHQPTVFANSATLASCENFQIVSVANGSSSRALSVEISLVSSPYSERMLEFETGTSFVIGDIRFEPFSIMHDASDPVGFRISSAGVALAVVTDLGQVSSLVRERIKGVDALILEANHDPDLLMEAPYPWELKQRIKSRFGHLSNQAAGELLREISTQYGSQPQYESSCHLPRLRVVVAAHISEKSNYPELAIQCFQDSWKAGGSVFTPEFVAAGAFSPTRLFTLSKVEGEMEICVGM